LEEEVGDLVEDWGSSLVEVGSGVREIEEGEIPQSNCFGISRVLAPEFIGLWGQYYAVKYDAVDN
jgi:hypothetical protein